MIVAIRIKNHDDSEGFTTIMLKESFNILPDFKITV